MGNRAAKQATQAARVAEQRAVAQKSKPSLLNSHLRITNIESTGEDANVLYTYKEDYEVIQQMKQMDTTQRNQFTAQLNADSKQQDELLKQAEAAAQYQQEQQSRQYSSLKDDKFLKQFLQQQETTQQEQTKLEQVSYDDNEWLSDTKNESYVGMIQKLSTNIVSNPTNSNLSEMPEYMKGNLAKAKPIIPKRERLQRPQEVDS